MINIEMNRYVVADIRALPILPKNQEFLLGCVRFYAPYNLGELIPADQGGTFFQRSITILTPHVHLSQFDTHREKVPHAQNADIAETAFLYWIAIEKMHIKSVQNSQGSLGSFDSIPSAGSLHGNGTPPPLSREQSLDLVEQFIRGSLGVRSPAERREQAHQLPHGGPSSGDLAVFLGDMLGSPQP